MEGTVDLLDAISVFVTVHETGSLSATSKRLGTSLPTVSRKLSELEGHLGTRLVVRSTRSVTLTDAGVTYLTAARNILDEVAAAERAARGEHEAARGELTVSAPVMLGRLHVLPIVSGYLALHPDVRVRLRLTDRNVRLVDEHVDVAVRLGELADSGLTVVRVGAVRRVICASPDYLARVGEPRTPDDLHHLACVTFDCLEVPSVWTFRRPDGRERGTMEVPIRSRLSANTAEAVIDAVLAGAGVAQVGAYQVVSAVRRGSLRTVLDGFEPEPLPVSVLHATRDPMPRKIRAFLDLLVARLRQNLA